MRPSDPWLQLRTTWHHSCTRVVFKREKRWAPAALVIRLTVFFLLFFFLFTWISSDTLCHLKTIFLTASAQREITIWSIKCVRLRVTFRESRPSEGFMSFTFSGVSDVFSFIIYYNPLPKIPLYLVFVSQLLLSCLLKLLNYFLSNGGI